MARAPSPEHDVQVRKRLLGLAIVVVVGAGGVWYLLGRDTGLVTGDILTQARFPAAITVLPDGTIRYSERLTGQVRDVSPNGELASEPVAEVDVSPSGQRGLLGVAVDEDGRTFASWTRPSDQVLVVGQVAPGEVRIVWEGPETSELNVGGHIAFDPNGDLVIGIGDLQEPDAVLDASLPNGKVLALDPDGPATQEPRTISSGWTNPMAFDFAEDGSLWLADNASDGGAERLTRGDLDARRYPITQLPEGTVPSGLAATEEHLFVCGFESRELLRYRRRGDEAAGRGRVLATNCSLGVAELPDGRLAYSNEGTIFTLDPSSPEGG